jgi:hypothetical protein
MSKHTNNEHIEQEIKKYLNIINLFSTKNLKIINKKRYLKKKIDLIIVPKYPFQDKLIE